MREAHEPPRELQRRPFTRDDALQVIGRHTLAGPGYVRLARGAHWVSGEEPSLGRRIQALRLVLPADAVLAGQAAAYAHGVQVWHAALIEVIHRRHLRDRPGVRLRRDRLSPEEICSTALGLATSPSRTAYDLARHPSTDEAVARVDAILRATGTSVAQVLRLLDDQPGGRGVRRARRVLLLADPRAESPRESVLRVRLVRAGLPAPVPQHVVRDRDGRFIARLDLAWPELKIGIEYDGGHHRDPVQHSRDLARHNRLRAAGWTVLQVDSAQLARWDDLMAALYRLLPR